MWHKENRIANFSPCSDSLIAKYGLITASIYGKIFRYCHMEEGVCRASHARLAKELGISEKTLRTHLKPLLDDGYVRIVHRRRGEPNHYALTDEPGFELQEDVLDIMAR